MDEKDLKIQALTERLSQIVSEDENKIADLRVTITIQQAKIEKLEREAGLAGDQPEVLEGEVVE